MSHKINTFLGTPYIEMNNLFFFFCKPMACGTCKPK